jgi:hypothetical protein
VDRSYRGNGSPSRGDLGAKLAGVDVEFSAERRRHAEDAAIGTETRMRDYERQCEIKAKDWAHEEVGVHTRRLALSFSPPRIDTMGIRSARGRGD